MTSQEPAFEGFGMDALRSECDNAVAKLAYLIAAPSRDALNSAKAFPQIFMVEHLPALPLFVSHEWERILYNINSRYLAITSNPLRFAPGWF